MKWRKNGGGRNRVGEKVGEGSTERKREDSGALLRSFPIHSALNSVF